MTFQFKLGLKKSPQDNRDLKLSVPSNKVLPMKHEIPIIKILMVLNGVSGKGAIRGRG